MAQTQVILLERIERLGNLGETVTVKPGYARNYLLPQKKALRATKDNIAYFQAQRKGLEAENEKNKKEAEKLAKKLEGLKVPLIRQASEAGQLYGSVTSRDIAKEVSEASKEAVGRDMVHLNRTFKLIGLFPVDIVLHPEVKVEITVNIARSAEEAQMQEKSGKALIADDGSADQETKAAPAAPEEAALEEVLEEGALEAEKEKQAEAEETAKAAAEADQAKAEAKAAEQAAKAEAAEEMAAESAESEESKPEEAEADKKEDE